MLGSINSCQVTPDFIAGSGTEVEYFFEVICGISPYSSYLEATLDLYMLM